MPHSCLFSQSAHARLLEGNLGKEGKEGGEDAEDSLSEPALAERLLRQVASDIRVTNICTIFGTAAGRLSCKEGPRTTQCPV